MLHICCVQTGNYQGRGAEYVNRLFDMVRRNLPAGMEGEFVCFTDDLTLDYHEDITTRGVPVGLQGWWNKLSLFQPGLFPDGDRVVFFDLDTLIIGALDETVKWDGEFAMLKDFYRPGGGQSSVMLWRSGFGHHLWNEYKDAGFPTHDVGGDQSWIEKRVDPSWLQDLFPGDFVSYKADCGKYPPKGAKVIVFHGNPRPHEVLDGWVPDVWKVGGIGSLEVLVRCNTEMDTLKRNVAHALSLGLPELVEQPANDKSVCIVGGGPSLKNSIGELTARGNAGQDIWALNNSAQYLVDQGVKVSGQWFIDARPFNARFVTPGMMHYVASQCDASVFEAAKGEVTLYHEATCDEFITKRPVTLIGGGTTVAMKALCGAYALGYRVIHVYGLDSSFDGETHHAYAQSENDGDAVVDVNVGDRRFKAAPWMVRQVEDFMSLANELAQRGCEIHVHCGGLLGYVSRKMQDAREAPVEVDGDVIMRDGLWRPISDRVSVSAVLDEVWKVRKIIEALPNRRTVVQAGGHVGIFANSMSGFFKDVYTFEPDPVNYKCLRRNVNAWNIHEFNKALGAEHGKIALTERDDHNCGSIGVDLNGVPTIEQIPLDDMDLRNVDLIYLDIEGMEGPALWGASRTVDRDRPIIVCENKGLDDVAGAEGQLDRFIGAHGYRKVARLMRDDVFAPLEKAEEFERALN